MPTSAPGIPFRIASILNFLRKSAHEPQVDRKRRSRFELVNLTRYDLTFRASEAYAVQSSMLLEVHGPTDGGPVQRRIKLVIRVCRQVEAKRFEIIGDLFELPAEWDYWMSLPEFNPLEVMTVEHTRAHARYHTKFSVMSADLPGFKALARNISMGGIGLHLREPVDPGRELDVRLCFDDDRVPSVEVRLHTVWCQPRNAVYIAGFRFVDLEPNQEEAIRAYVSLIQSIRDRLT